MACQKCGCKVTYTYCDDDILGLPGDQERCPNCGVIFYVDDSAEDDDEGDGLLHDRCHIDMDMARPAKTAKVTNSG